MENYNRQLHLYFRNGKMHTIYTNALNIRKGPRASGYYLYVEGDPIISLGLHQGNIFSSKEITFHNASPLPMLFEKLPDDWDKEDPALRIIDKVLIQNLDVTTH